MKKHVLFQTNSQFIKVFLLVLISCFIMGANSLNAEVLFPQTTNADFNKGVLNGAVVGSDNVYLQFAASGVGTWLTATVLPQTLAGHKTVSWNDRFVYMVGGYNNTAYVNNVYVASISGGGISGWTALTSLPVALRDPAVVIGTNTIYVMGGRNATTVFNTIYYASINTDGTIGAWQTSAVTLPVNLWGHTATYMMGHIYVIGGTSSLTETTALNSVYYTKVNTTNILSAFTAGTSLTSARNRHSTVTYNSKLYVLGGYDNTGTRAGTVYIATPALNGSTGSWSAGTALPVAISNHASVAANGLITVMAGDLGGGSLSNAVYFANADAGSLTWNLSPTVLYNNTKDGAAFTGNGLAFYTGGAELSGEPIAVCRFANLTLTANYANHGVFVSNPFYELGATRLINSLAFTKVYTSPQANLQVTYRTAGSDGVWSDWNSTLSTTSPITVNLTQQFLQYAVIFTGSTTFNSTLNDVTLSTPGTQLAGSLNGTLAFTKAASPYWATSDISFTANTHTFEAGTLILFLPETGLSVGAASLICNGTSVDSVKFTYFTNESGKWDGIYFDDNSDAGVSSQFYYTSISNAGFGANNANLYCYLSNEPKLMNCKFYNAGGHGVRLNGSLLTIENCAMNGNTESGLYLDNSSPVVKNSILAYNGFAGVTMTSDGSMPNFLNTALNNNLYAFYMSSLGSAIRRHVGTVTLTNNTYNGIGIPGGTFENSVRWHALDFPIFLTDNLTVGRYYDVCRLTIEPGNTIKIAEGKKIQIGFSTWYPYGGELYALGDSDSLITFTSINGADGGWNGLYFHDLSDYNGATSVMDYCVVEKGNSYNIYSENSSQPSINHSTIRNALQDGMKFYGAYNSIQNSTFQANGRYPLFFSEPHTCPVLNANSYSGNTINFIGYCGGTLSDSRTFQNDGIGYHIIDNIVIGKYYAVSRLTIEPGLTFSFASGKGIQVGYSTSYPYGGELYAVGKSDSVITFTPHSGTAGDWTGIYFNDYSDYNGAVNQLKYCNVNKANAYNVLCENTGSVTIDHCTFANAVTDGLRYNASGGSFNYCTFSNNGRYPVNFLDWTSQPAHKNNTFTGNVVNMMALSGGTYEESKILVKDNAEYLVLGNIKIGRYYGVCRLTIQPGVTLNFASGKNIQVGFATYYPYGGELYAVGKADSLITFTSHSGTAGDWNGIFFHDMSDYNGAVSPLKYCVIKKGNIYNVKADWTTQPAFEYSTLTQALGDGLNISSSALTIKNSTFTYNTGFGINIEGSSTAAIGNTSALTCNILNNFGAYDLYNNTTNTIDARYNFWGTGDSTMAHLRIYDKSENAAKGRVYIGPFAQVPALYTPTTVMGGVVKYMNTGRNPIKNAAMTVKDFANTTIVSTTTNTSGVYGFASMASGNYKLTITPAVPPQACVNSTDALNILNHFAQITPLTGMNLACSDVNFSHSVNGTDALLVMQRYTGGIATFPVGNYLYHYDTVIMNGINVTGNIDMICFGDVNASYEPAKKSSGNVGIIHEGSQIVESFTEFEMPVKLKTGMQVGAISLGFYYPEEYLEITGARLINGVTGFSWTAADGLFRMGWCDLNALSINNENVIVYLQMKTKDVSDLKTGIHLEIYDYCEFADVAATPYEGAIVSVPVINTKLTGVPVPNNLAGLSVYPNPVNENSVVTFSLERPGNVRMTLVEMIGNNVLTVASGDFGAGSHKVALKASSVKPGMYVLKIENTINGQTTAGMIKIVVSN